MNEQLSLFGQAPDPNVPPGRRVPAPAPVDDAVRALAKARPDGLYLGTSSWSFPGWGGIVYDTPYDAGLLAREGLRAYANHPLLNAVSIDRTYYSSLSAEAFSRYAEQVPEDFRFMVKAPAVLTTPWDPRTDVHAPADNPRYLDPALARTQWIEPAREGLGGRRGPLLLQFPPQGRRVTRMARTFAVRLAAFLSELPRDAGIVVELRDAELWTDETLSALRDHDARPCLSIHPRSPPLDRQRVLLAGFPPGPLTVRWNLAPALRYEQALEAFEPFDRIRAPDDATLEAVAGIVRASLHQRRRVLVIANNKAEGSAPLTLVRLARALWGDRASTSEAPG